MKVFVAIHPYTNSFIGVFKTKEALKKQVKKEYSIAPFQGKSAEEELEQFVNEEFVQE
jgi:hypothetical protein